MGCEVGGGSNCCRFRVLNWVFFIRQVGSGATDLRAPPGQVMTVF